MRIERVRILEVNDLVRAEQLRGSAGSADLVGPDITLRIRHDADPRRRHQPQLAGDREPRIADRQRCGVPIAVAILLDDLIDNRQRAG